MKYWHLLKSKDINWKMVEIRAYLIMLFAICFYIAFLAFYPFKAIDVYNQPYELKETVIPAGSWIHYEVDYCRYTNVDSYVIHELVSKEGSVSRIFGNTTVEPSSARTSTSDGIRLTEGCGVLTKSVYIPGFVEENEYILRETVTYKITPFQTTGPYIFETEWFTVTPQKSHIH